MKPRSALSYALLLLKIRDRSSGELRAKMRQKEYLDTDIEATIQNLTEKNLLNDERFVASLVRSQKEYHLSGKRKIQRKLFERNIPSELINKYLCADPESEESRAKELATRWLEQKGERIDKDKRYLALGRFLAGKGFEAGVVYEVLGEIFRNNQ